jgi:hypothetical protein
MPGHIWWKAVLVGAVVAYLVAMAISFISAAVLVTVLRDGLAGGGTPDLWPEPAWLSLLITGLMQFLAFLVGGCVAGRMAGIAGGPNGAMSALLGLLVQMAPLVISMGPDAGPSVSSGDLGMFTALSPLFFVITICGGLLGGMLGERLHLGTGLTQN